MGKPSDVHGSRDSITIIKMAMLPKLTYRLDAIPVTIPAAFFVQIDKLILKFIWNFKGTVETTLVKKRIKWEDPHFPLSKLTAEPQ